MTRIADDGVRQDRLTENVEVYVPAAGREDALGIAPASGIVGRVQDDGRVLIYSEGNLHGAENIRTYADRLAHAASRMAVAYPTTSTRLVSAGDVVRVGSFDPEWGRVRLDDEVALARWLGTDEVADAERHTSEGTPARRREVRAALERPDLAPGARTWVEQEARRLGLR